MEVKPGYQQTEAGVIPEDWQVTNLGSICAQVTTGKLDANAMNPDGPYRFYTCAKDFYQIDTYAFDAEALLISGNGANVGYVHYYNGKFNAYQRTYVLSGFLVSIKYLQHYMSETLADRIRVEVKAGNTPYITRGTLTEMKVSLPPTKAEQEAIAEALNDADALIESLEQLVAKKRHLKQGAMEELLTGKKRLTGFEKKKGYKQTGIGVIPEDWNVTALGSLCDIVAGRDLVKDHFSPSSDHRHEFPIYSNALTNRGLYGYSKVFQFEANKITVTARGDIGHAAYRNSRFCAIGRLLVLSSKREGDLRFVTEFINNIVDFAVESTGVPQLTAPQVSKYTIALPPTEAEQTAIAAILSDMDAEIAALEAKLAKARCIKQGMMQELLTGRVRLI